MRRIFIPFLSFLIILLLAIPFSFDLATSVVPGWHTTIFTPHFIWGLIVIFLLLLVTIGYWILSKRIDRINWSLFTIHLILTLPAMIFLKFPAVILDIQTPNQADLVKTLALQTNLILLAWVLFMAGQILFLIYFIRAA